MTPAMKARTRLGLLVLLLTLSVWNGPVSPQPQAMTDSQLFSNVISRMQRGESYYPVMGQELRAGGYPTASVFNWRTPAWYYALAWPFTRYLFILVTFGAAWLSFRQLRGDRVFARVVSLIALVGTPIAAFTEGVSITDAVCGVFIAYSLFAYRKQAWTTGAVVAVLALFVRELAAPYVVACAVIALWHRRWRECAVWMGGAVLYFAYFGWHAHMVTLHQLPGAQSHAESWIQGGGLRFVLGTVSSNLLLMCLPKWVTAVMFVTIAAGVTSSRLSNHVRACTVAYLTAFAVIGQPFNLYWGWVPLFAFALSAGAGAEVIRQQAVLALRPAVVRFAVPDSFRKSPRRSTRLHETAGEC